MTTHGATPRRPETDGVAPAARGGSAAPGQPEHGDAARASPGVALPPSIPPRRAASGSQAYSSPLPPSIPVGQGAASSWPDSTGHAGAAGEGTGPYGLLESAPSSALEPRPEYSTPGGRPPVMMLGGQVPAWRAQGLPDAGLVGQYPLPSGQQAGRYAPVPPVLGSGADHRAVPSEYGALPPPRVRGMGIQGVPAMGRASVPGRAQVPPAAQAPPVFDAAVGSSHRGDAAIVSS